MIEQKGQLFFDPEMTGLSKKAIAEMIKEKNEMLYPIALNHFHSLIPSIENMMEADMQWLKMEFTVPYFMDLCFRAKNSVYGIIFGQEKDDSNIYFPLDLDISIRKCEENDIIPCVLVFDKNLDILPLTDDKWCLIDAKALFFNREIKPIIPDNDNSSASFKAMGKWEELNNAIMAYVQDLRDKQEIADILYQSYPGVDPAVCWIDKEGMFNWMMIRTMKEGEEEPAFDPFVVDKLSSTGGKGHLSIALLSNSNTKAVLPRGESVDIKMEIEDLN